MSTRMLVTLILIAAATGIIGALVRSAVRLCQ